MYYAETENHQKISTIANELLQQNFLLLSANNLITNDMQTKYTQLYKMFDGRTTKFAGDELLKGETEDYDILHAHNMDDDIEFENVDDLAQHEIETHQVFAVPMGAPRAKRALNDVTVTNSMPKRFACSAAQHADNLNSTHVVSKHCGDDLDEDIKPISVTDTTFCMEVKPKGILTNKQRQVPAIRVLKESNPNINKEASKGRHLVFYTYFNYNFN